MGHAVDALGDGLRNLAGNPMLVVIAYVVSAVTVPVFLVVALAGFVLAFVPIVGQLLAYLLFAATVKPLLLGGVLGPAGDGVAGEVELRDAGRAVAEHFPSLAGAFSIYELIRFAVSLVLGVVLLVVLLVGSVGSLALDDPATAFAGLGVVLVVGYALALLVVLGLAVVFQFVDAAVVLGDASASDALRESWGLAREAPLSVLGYAVLRVLVAGLVVLPGLVLAVAGSRFGDAFAWAGLGVTLLLSPVALAVVMSYHAAYYGHRIRGGRASRH